MANCTCIKLKTVDQRLTIVQQPILASGDIGTVRVEYELDQYWDGFTLSGTFYHGKHPDEIYEQLLSSGECVIPWEALREEGVLFIGLRGVDEVGLVKTAAPVRYKIEKGSPRGTGSTTEPTPDVYQQILSNMQEMAGDLKEHSEDEIPHIVNDERFRWNSALRFIGHFTNANELTEPGIYFIGAGTEGAPDTRPYHLIVTKTHALDEITYTQTAICLYPGVISQFTRHSLSEGGWSNWRAIVTTDMFTISDDGTLFIDTIPSIW